MAEDNFIPIDLTDDIDNAAEVKHNPNPEPPAGPYIPKKAEPATAPALINQAKPEPLMSAPKVPKHVKVIKIEDVSGTLNKTAVPAVSEISSMPSSVPLSPPTPELTELDNLERGVSIALNDDDSSASPINDRETNLAVDDIAEKEGDTLLALEDAQAGKRTRAVAESHDSNWKNRLKSLFKNKWTWLAVLMIIVGLFTVPVTRYKLLGLVIKKTVNVNVVDSRNGTPVSSAEVSLGSSYAKTDGDGRVKLKVGVGKHKLSIIKKYYTSLTSSYTVSFKSGQLVKNKLVATGRLVPITVTNKLTGQPIKAVVIKIRSTLAKTNADGQASVGLPADTSSDAATISLNGYNTDKTIVQVTNQVVAANNLQLTPSGKLYFLSNSSGTIDVIKSNLDGSSRQVALAGTGHETQSTTSLLASPDWQYLVLEANRDGSASPGLYLINTATNKVTEFEDSGASITPIGWSGDDFLYDLTKSSESFWQSGREVLKSYNATDMQTNQLDQNQAEGSANAYAYQSFNDPYIINGSLVYTTQWNTFDASGSYDTSGKNNTIRAVGLTGLNKTDYESLSVDTTNYIQAKLFQPGDLYFAVSNDTDGSTNYYEYQNQSVKTVAINASTFSTSYPTYVISPTGDKSLWKKLLDGQNSLFVGDGQGANQKEIINSGSYSPYGWYSDKYVLISKDGSELYIVPSAGLGKGQQPLELTDYYKPSISAASYGGY